MRKQEIVSNFVSGIPAKSGNYLTNGKSLFLHGNEIARLTDRGTEINLCGWITATTKSTINLISDNVKIGSKKDQVFMNGKPIPSDEWVLLE